MQEHPTTVSESSLLRSPKASEGQGGALGEAEALRRGNTVGVRDQIMDLVASQGMKVSRQADNLLPTPAVAHLRNHDEDLDEYMERRQDFIDGKVKGMPGASLGVAVRMQQAGIDWKEDVLLPTVTTQDAKNNGGPSQYDRNTLPLNTEVMLMGTPRANAATATPRQVDAGAPKGRIEDQVLTTEWGKFEPAIRRWEAILGRPAPAPTKPDGKDGAHRLSEFFTEWMMGVPMGWITDCGLTRNEALKACGNGVVPQQAELALRILLGDSNMAQAGDDAPVLPTVMANSPMRNSRRSMVTHPTKRSSVALNQAIELVQGILPPEFENWDEVPDGYRDLERERERE